MFGWTKNRRRRELLESPLSHRESQSLSSYIWQASYLSQVQASTLLRWMRVFIAEKNWEGCQGLAVTEDMKQTIAASAGLMVMAYPEWYFDRTETLLIHPRPYAARTPTSALPNGIVGETYRAGETVYRGPVVLNWRDVELASNTPNHGNHLVIHEMAHQLDMINGPSADGIPPLPKHVNEEAWRASLAGEYDAACDVVKSGDEVLIDDYGLTSLSEFFAVASEYYFQIPDELAYFHPGVFKLLLQFYQVDLRQKTS
jgi:MtfA peptidase